MKRVLVLVAVGALALGACGDDDDGGDVRETDGGSGSGSASGSGVAAECEPVGDASGADVTVEVDLLEFEIQVAEPEGGAGTIPAGTVHFALDNVGVEPHEFLVVRGVAPEDLPVDGDGALVEDDLPDGALVGEVEPFPGGSSCDGTFELDAGEYTLLCNIVEEVDGEIESHLAEGMVTTITVG